MMPGVLLNIAFDECGNFIKDDPELLAKLSALTNCGMGRFIMHDELVPWFKRVFQRDPSDHELMCDWWECDLVRIEHYHSKSE